MASIEEQYRLLQSVLSISSMLVRHSENTDLEKIDELLTEQQRLLDKALSEKALTESSGKSSPDRKEITHRYSVLISGISANMKNFISILQEKKCERFQYIKQAQRQRSLSTYIQN
jgi:hypothetical protein